MTDAQIARFALAAIHTELEDDFEAVQTIASEALELTRASAKDLRLDGYHGMESWREFRRLNGI